MSAFKSILKAKSSHDTKNSSWLPPMDSWMAVEQSLPYGWELAADKEGSSYFINHLNKTTTYEDPRKEDDEPPPEPRQVTLTRDSELGFGFVAGSERPVLVRFVKEGGPSEGLLQSGDQILRINGEDVSRAPREHVIELVKSCKHSVTLTICQPQTNNSARKSAILTSAKKAKLKSNPSRVRFAEGVVINESPLCPSTPFLPNVLKVFLENGQTKTFKYDSTTCIQDVLNSLTEKLSIKCGQHFSLCVEHIKSMRRNKLTLLDPKDAPAKIAARPGSHNLRCLFRVAFVPKDAAALQQRDPTAFEYLYVQTCNDVVKERFSPELKYDVALRLAALQLHQHAISNGMLSSSGKVNLKGIDKDCGLGAFVPVSLLESMKRKELHKILSHFLKQNQSLCPGGQKTLTAGQAKVHYLRLVGELPSFGAKVFPTNIRESNQVESAVLVSPKYGLSHVSGLRSHLATPLSLARIEDISAIKVTKEDDLCYSVEVQQRPANGSGLEPPPLRFSLEDKDAEELVVAIQGYHRLFTSGQGSPRKELPVYRDIGDSWWSDNAPMYHSQHLVKETPWAYIPAPGGCQFRRIDLTVPPPRYTSSNLDGSNGFVGGTNDCDISKATLSSRPGSLFAMSKTNGSAVSLVDHNMNLSTSDMDISLNSSNRGHEALDLPSIISTELLEAENPELGRGKVRGEDIVQRVQEMNQIVTDAQNYLSISTTKCRTLEATAEDVVRMSRAADQRSEQCPNHSSSGDSDNLEVDLPGHEESRQLKAADSLLLLTQIDGHGPSAVATGSVATASAASALMRDGKEIAAAQEPINGDLSPDESDTDSLASTPAASPLHHGHHRRPSGLNLRLRTNLELPDEGGGRDTDLKEPEMNSSSSRAAKVSSFGLHSPDQPPNLSDTENELIETLKNIQDGHAALQFAEASLYLDTDIIDLTVIPPPDTPDADFGHNDNRFGASSSNVLMFSGNPPTPYREDLGDPLAAFRSRTQLDTERVVADLDILCDTLSEMKASPTPLSNSSSNHHRQTTLELLPTNIDEFIASLAIPPPPPASEPPRTPFAHRKRFGATNSSAEALDTEEEDIYASLIIPPPPPSMSHGSDQDDVIAKFWRATDDVKKICVMSSNVRNVQSNGHHGGHHVQSHHPHSQRDAPSPRSVAVVREVHSSSSGDSGYESIMSQGEWAPSNMDHLNGSNQHPTSRFCLPTVQESSPTSNDRSPVNGFDCPTLTLNCSGLEVPTPPAGKPPRAPKPPIPPGSPSIMERRKQIARQKANGTLPVGGMGDKLSPSSPSNGSNGSNGSSCSSQEQKERNGTNVASVESREQTNGFDRIVELYNDITSPSSNTSSSHDMMSTNGSSETHDFDLVRDDLDQLFAQSQRDIDVLLSRLEEVHEARLRNYALENYGHLDEAKLSAARDALVSESRQFVTSSKLFVKCATESAPELLNHLVECVALLDRMFNVGELVVVAVESQAQVSCLVDRLKEVAATYAYTVDTVHKLTDATSGQNSSELDPSNSPYMGLLMSHATSLATALSALMRTLRTLT